MCGHDGHMAMLLGGARLLHEHRDSLQVSDLGLFEIQREIQ